MLCEVQTTTVFQPCGTSWRSCSYATNTKTWLRASRDCVYCLRFDCTAPCCPCFQTRYLCCKMPPVVSMPCIGPLQRSCQAGSLSLASCSKHIAVHSSYHPTCMDGMGKAHESMSRTQPGQLFQPGINILGLLLLLPQQQTARSATLAASAAYQHIARRCCSCTVITKTELLVAEPVLQSTLQITEKWQHMTRDLLCR